MADMTPHDDWENFGIWSASGLAKALELLTSLGARTEVYPEILSEDRLRSWHAWDSESSEPHKGFHLYIHRNDLGKVGDQIIVMFPERKF
jgi:hypothetical protein